jgi:beta-galactosidase/beta-glucuronidase
VAGVRAANFRAANLTLASFEHCTVAHRVRLPMLRVPEPQTWDAERPFLHSITVLLHLPATATGSGSGGSGVGQFLDGVRVTFGLRTVSTAAPHRLLVNGRPTHLRGFDRHEQARIRVAPIDWNAARDTEHSSL